MVLLACEFFDSQIICSDVFENYCLFVFRYALWLFVFYTLELTTGRFPFAVFSKNRRFHELFNPQTNFV